MAAVVAGGIVPGRADSSPTSSRAASTGRSTTLAATVGTPVKMRGLLAEQTFVVSDVGAADARAVRAHIRLAAGLSVRHVTSTKGKCTLAPPAAVDCRPGTIRAGAAVTVRVRYRLSYVRPTTRNDVHLAAGNAANAAASGPSYFMDRYWVCGCSTVYTYPNGWTVPATDQGVSVGADDTVRLSGGYFISPDGVLHFPDGRMIKDTLTAELFIPRKA